MQDRSPSGPATASPRAGSPEPDPAGSGPLSSLARGIAVYGMGRALNRLVTFLMLPVLTRYLTPGDYGISAILDVLCAFVVAVFSLGFGSSLTLAYFESRDVAYRRSTVSTAFLLLAASVAVLLGGGVVAAPAISRWVLGAPDHARLVFLSLGTAALMILPQPFSLRLQLEERAPRLVAIGLVSTVLVMALSLFAVVVLGRGVHGLWEGRLGAHLVTCLLFAAHFPPKKLLRFSRPLAAELMRLGLPMIPAFASLFVLLQANRYLLSLFADLETVGVYSVGVQLGTVMGLAVSAFTAAWTPYFMSFSDRQAEAGPLFSRVMTYYVLGFGGLSLLFYAVARPFLLVMVPPAFHEAYLVAGYAATAQFMIGVFNVLLPACSFAKEIKYSGLIQAIAAALALAFNAVLIPLAGMRGAGLALVLGTASMAALLWAWNRRRRDRYLVVPYDGRRLGIFGGVYVLLAGTLVLDRQWSLAMELPVAVAAGLLILVTVLALLDRGERGWLIVFLRSLVAPLRSIRRAPAVGGHQNRDA